MARNKWYDDSDGPFLIRKRLTRDLWYMERIEKGSRRATIIRWWLRVRFPLVAFPAFAIACLGLWKLAALWFAQ